MAVKQRTTVAAAVLMAAGAMYAWHAVTRAGARPGALGGGHRGSPPQLGAAGGAHGEASVEEREPLDWSSVAPEASVEVEVDAGLVPAGSMVLGSPGLVDLDCTFGLCASRGLVELRVDCVPNSWARQ